MRTPLLVLGCGIVVACAPGALATADARMVLLDDARPGLALATGPQPDGSPGLGAADGAYLTLTGSKLLPGRRGVRVVDADATPAAARLLGAGPSGMARVLREAIRAAGSHRVVVDDVGPAFRGRDGRDLAAALGALGRERAPYATGTLARRVHLYVAVDAGLFTDADAAGVRAAMGRAGGVWLKTTAPDGSPWTDAQWQTWPAQAADALRAGGSTMSRLHVVIGAGDQDAAWRNARTGATCPILANGPGGYRLGAHAPAFVAQFRLAFRPAGGPKGAPVACDPGPGPDPDPGPALPAGAVAALLAGFAAEESGVAIPAGGLITPPLVAGEPAQVDVRLADDPIGLAAALGVSTERLWGAAGARLAVAAPGVADEVPVGGDGVARLAFTPTAPGPVTLTLRYPAGPAVASLAGGADVARALGDAGAPAAAVARVAAAPGAWELAIPVVREGGAPGDAVVEVVPPFG